MQDLSYQDDTFNKVIYILAFCFFGVTFIWMVVNSVCFCCTRHNEGICYKFNTIFYSGMFCLISITMTVLVAINSSQLQPKYDSLIKWADYAGCVDSYM